MRAPVAIIAIAVAIGLSFPAAVAGEDPSPSEDRSNAHADLVPAPELTASPAPATEGLAGAVLDEIEVADDPTRGEAMDLAKRALQLEREVGTGDTSAHLADAHQRQLEKLDTVETILELAEDTEHDPLERKVRVAQVATRAQAEQMGYEWTEPPSPTMHEAPSEALIELADRYDVTPTPDQRADLDELDELPAPIPERLTRFVDAFLLMEEAAREAYQDADLDALQATARSHPIEERLIPTDTVVDTEPVRTNAAFDGAQTSPAAMLAEHGVDLADVFPARHTFLDTILQLEDALDGFSQPASHTPTVQIPPVFSIDLDTVGETYDSTENYALVLDEGGADTYQNNAGGNNMLTPNECPPDGALMFPAAALVDLEGGDTYEPVGLVVSSTSPGYGECGVNGGGYTGVGFLFDADSGLDTLDAKNYGINGGGAQGGVGFLFDENGASTYVANLSRFLVRHPGANGGGARGAGMLIDGGTGTTSYIAFDGAVNGGASHGSGFLLDWGGNDDYDAQGEGTNGGSVLLGSGFLLDLGGDDSYSAWYDGVNGGATSGGSGTLVNIGGPTNDSYTAGVWWCCDDVAGTGVNGGVKLGQNGSALLLDVCGLNDEYTEWSGGSATTQYDSTVLTKGNVGNQVDLVNSGIC